jgi:TolB protein
MVRPTRLLLAALISACGGDLNAPQTPTLEVAAVTTGQPVDPDGYSIQVDGGPTMPLGVNATIRVTDLIPGSHEIVLDGVAVNCRLSGPNVRMVGVSAGDITTVRFEVQCSTPPGSLEIVIATTGDEPDPDGYLISVDGEPGVPVGLTGTLNLPSVTAGDHEIRLSGLAPNCSLTGGNPRRVTVDRDPVRVDLEVHCSHPAGTIRITTITGGPQPDVDGYEVTIGGPSRHIDANASLTVADLPVGDIEVRLDGIASNCLVDGENPRTVSLTIGDLVSVTFSVACLPSGEGVILFSSDRSGTSHVYRIRQDGTDLRDLTPSFPAAGGDWSPDGTRIVFSRATDAGNELMIMDADGGNPTALGIAGAHPRWSPDGGRIAFTGPDGISVINADGSGATTLVEGADPDWSPDGTHIAFDRVERSQCVFDLFCPASIYVMDADGSGVKVVARNAGSADRLEDPDWSPDGKQILYIRSCCVFGPSLGGLYLVGATGGAPRALYQTRPVQSAPIWSPDGALILVATGGSLGSSDLTMIAADGSSSVMFARAPGRDFPQAWR